MNGNCIDAAMLLYAGSARTAAEQEKQQKSLDLLWKLTEGVAYETQTDTDAAYSKTVPSGAVAAEIGSIGGKTVRWNQQIGPTDWISAIHEGITFAASPDGGVTLSGSATAKAYKTSTRMPVVHNGDKILIFGIDNGSSGSYYLRLLPNSGNGIFAYGPTIGTYGFDNVNSFRILVAAGYSFSEPVTVYPRLVNLTQMFGADAPTEISDPRVAGIIAYAEQHPEYDSGSLLSAAVTSVVSKGTDDETLGTLELPAALREFLADKDYGASAGAVSNTIDWAAKTYTRRVKAIDMGDLNYYRQTAYGAHPFFTTYPGRPQTVVNNMISNIYSLADKHSLTDFGEYATDMSISANAGSGADQTGRLLVRDDRYASAAEIKAGLAGVILYLEIAEPEEYDISAYLPEDNMLDVEAGGTLTFAQDGDTTMEVPNSVAYLIKLSEVTP